MDRRVPHGERLSRRSGDRRELGQQVTIFGGHLNNFDTMKTGIDACCDEFLTRTSVDKESSCTIREETEISQKISPDNGNGDISYNKTPDEFLMWCERQSESRMSVCADVSVVHGSQIELRG